jgi:general secretion pathway protein D
MSNLRLKLQRSLLFGLLVFGAPALAQNSVLLSEAAARSADARDAGSLLEEGDNAYLENDYKLAIDKYAEALSKLPKGAQPVVGLRATAVQRFSQASLVQAQDLMSKGDAKNARALVKDAHTVDPDNPQLKLFLAKMDDPIRYESALTAEHTANVARVQRLLQEGQSYYDLGQFDRAYMTYEDILRIDRYNKAARRGKEMVNAAKAGYAEAARDQARAEMLKGVDGSWEQKAASQSGVPVIGGDDFGAVDQKANIQSKLNSINLPEVRLSGATLDEAVDFLRAVSVQADKTTLDEAQKGVPFLVQLGDESMPEVQKIRDSRIDLTLRNVPLAEVLKLVNEASGTTFRVDDFAVVINAAGFSDPTLVRREFRVSPDFLTTGAVGKAEENKDPFGADDQEGGLIAKKLSAKEKLQGFGVSFPDEASAAYNSNTNMLIVRNTVANMQLIEAIVADLAKSEPLIVTVRTTIVDISQDQLDELDFDSMLGEFNVGEHGILSGGTTGTGAPITDMIGGRPVTSGNRSGQLAGTTEGLDALLKRVSPPTASGVLSNDGVGGGSADIRLPSTPDSSGTRGSGIISLRGIIDNSAHEILMRGLSQKKGVDVMVRPEVVTRSGQNAVVQSVVEFPYPEDFEPPQIPNQVAGGGGIVTPATPTNFITRNLGITLEVLPQVGPDRKIIEVSVNPVVTDFEGFVNYGTPIVGSSNTASIDFVNQTVATQSVFGEITANAILKPLFRTTRGNTSVRVVDGQTVVMGGLIKEIRKEIHDKVPILGELPLVGRIFQSNGISVEKRALIIFVNVELTDPAGKPYRDR